MVMILQTISAVAFGLVWPIIQMGIDNFAKMLVDMGALGVDFYVFKSIVDSLWLASRFEHLCILRFRSYTSPSGEVSEEK